MFIDISPNDTLIIKKASNGMIITSLEQYDDNSEYPITYVFEEKREMDHDEDNHPEELIAMRNTLHHILEYFGIYCSKHDKFHLTVKIEQNEVPDSYINTCDKKEN